MAQSNSNVDRDKYPPVSFYFKVSFEGITGTPGEVDTRFQEATGFTAEIATEEIQEGGENRFTYRVPKNAKYGNLVLKRGVMVNSGLIEWISDAIDNFTFNPANVVVTLLNEEGQPLITWDFFMVYPVKWSTGDLKATENAVLVETLELAYQFYTKKYHN